MSYYPDNCFSCFVNGGVHCIDDQFTSSECCDYQDGTLQEECISKYKFCTKGLEQSVYKVFTCPPFSCPNGFEQVMHTNLNEEIRTEINWGSFSDGFNCKAKINAADSLNGKLRVRMNVKGAYIYLYQ